MRLKNDEITRLLEIINFKKREGQNEIFYKEYPQHNDYVIEIDFKKNEIKYTQPLRVGDKTTSNFENSENFVVLECIDRLLMKGYSPSKISLEHKWPMGRKEKGKLDVLIFDSSNKPYLMIECKTYGDEYIKELNKMKTDGGKLFSYFQQDKAAKFLVLYSSRIQAKKIEYKNDIIKVEEIWRNLDNQKEVYDHWNKNFEDNGIFDDWSKPYNIEIQKLTRGGLKALTEEDSKRIFNQFAQILRHNIVSDKPNAFNKIFNLFLCKIVDENRKPSDELKFQILESDTDEEILKRLSDLYKLGMKEYLTKEITDYNDVEISDKLYALDSGVRAEIKDMFTKIRLHKNNEFAFKEVYDEKSFRENAIVVRDVVKLLQPYQIRYGHKQQFLGDFFELLLSTGIKQEAGQFFTPVPIARFIVSSLPIKELINTKIQKGENNFLPYTIDFAAGSGHFLTEVMDEIQNIIENIDESIQKPSINSNLKSWRASSFDWANEYVYGIEADYRLVKTAKVSCFLNGDGLANVIHADGLDHFQKSLEYKGKLKETSKNDTKDNEQFDILVANPPYSVASFKNTLKNGKESFELFDRLKDQSSEIECLFIERAKQLLKEGGCAAIILPNAILATGGIYVDAREIILKHFTIKSIVELGSNTFMATGANTVILFLEKRPNNDWKKINDTIDKYFEKYQDVTISGIDDAFDNYVRFVYEDISLIDYNSLLKKKPNTTVLQQEFYLEYKEWFKETGLEKKIKTNKAFKELNEEKQNEKIDDLFHEFIFEKEKNKLLYYFLTFNQKSTFIRVGDKQAEKDFIGYEFSSRRGNEGIKIYKSDDGIPSTMLFDENDTNNIYKANTHIRKTFNKIDVDIPDILRKNVYSVDLINHISFHQIRFTKEISLNVKQKIILESHYEQKKIKKLFLEIKNGKNVSQFNKIGKYRVSRIESIADASFNINATKWTNDEAEPNDFLQSGDILFSHINSVPHLGKTAYFDSTEKVIHGVNLLRFRPNENEVYPPYIALLFKHPKFITEVQKYAQKAANQASVNSTNIKELKLPIPTISIQKNIMKELEKISENKKFDALEVILKK